jgi:hypothetical protein
MDNNIDTQILNAYLDPNDLAEKLSEIHYKDTKHRSGHIHIHFRDKSDHIILVWSKGQLKRIIAKSPRCKKGQYVHWKDSEFRDYNRQDVLGELCNEIELITIDHDGVKNTWSSYYDFIDWLLQS